MVVHTYVPQDRLRALARGVDLPDRVLGAVLFADISGFTSLTEALAQEFGSRRGMEELTRQVNAVYDALISVVERYGGSVLSFAGDAITCWFDDTFPANASPASLRGLAAGFAMQSAMAGFPRLGLKVSVASGPARRFVVGNPALHYLDTLAGATVARTALAESLAHRGEILADEATVQALGADVSVLEWRQELLGGERFAVVTALHSQDDPVIRDVEAPSSAQLPDVQPYLLPSVYERLASGQGSFLTELRPCAVLFVRFVGIDYEADHAREQLDDFIRRVQDIAAAHDGALLQLMIGDKGSYTYINFGALNAHEDDARRAVRMALELRDASVLTLQMGISLGVMRVGAYGGLTRRTYGALGDDVNVAARLMSAAESGEILVSSALQKATAGAFSFAPRPPLVMKGRSQELPVFAVGTVYPQRSVRLQEPVYTTPMIGRQDELCLMEEKLDVVLGGSAQVISIVGDAGLGKSRLAGEVIRAAHRRGFVGYGGGASSDGLNVSYRAWRSIWAAFFDIDPEQPLKHQIRLLETEVGARAPHRLQAVPLLGMLLDLAIPANDFTQSLEPQTRQSVLHALLEDCLRSAASEAPILLVMEDLHWIDVLSHDLVESLARALHDLPICFVLIYRPPQVPRLLKPRLEMLSHFTRVQLGELNDEESRQVIRSRLLELYPSQPADLPDALLLRLIALAQGNPFFLEELTSYLSGSARNLDDVAALAHLELPDSLHTLILSRIDRLSLRQKTLLRVASVIGRSFSLEWLVGYYPEIGTLPDVKNDLDELVELELLLMDTAFLQPFHERPDTPYLFRYIVTHEATYESMPFVMRANLHGMLAGYLETQVDGGMSLIDVIAYHYGMSDNKQKQRDYFRRAADAARATYANAAALEYDARLLALLVEPGEKADLHLQRGKLYQLIGEWQQAGDDYQASLRFAESIPDPVRIVFAQLAIGKFFILRGNYQEALSWLERASSGGDLLGDDVELLATIHAQLGIVYVRKGEYDEARVRLERALALGGEAGDRGRPIMALALNNLGSLSYIRGDYSDAWGLYHQALAIRRALDDKVGISASLNNLGNIANHLYKHDQARALFAESLSIKREMGDKTGIAASLNNLGNVDESTGNYASARKLYGEALSLRRELGDQWGIALGLTNLGSAALCQLDVVSARKMHRDGLEMCYAIGDKLFAAYNLAGLAKIANLDGDMQRAARLASAADALLVSINAAFPPLDREKLDLVIASTRDALGAAVFQSTWEAGQLLTFDAAVDDALESKNPRN